MLRIKVPSYIGDAFLLAFTVAFFSVWGWGIYSIVTTPDPLTPFVEVLGIEATPPGAMPLGCISPGLAVIEPCHAPWKKAQAGGH